MDQKPPAKDGGKRKRDETEGDKDEAKPSTQSSDDDESQEESMKTEADYSNLERLRKQKRLAMNRESARNRRKFKKEKLETLAAQVERLNQANQALQATVQTLSGKVQQLEGELSVARSTIAVLTGSSAPPGRASISTSAVLPAAATAAASPPQLLPGSASLTNNSPADPPLQGAAAASALQLLSGNVAARTPASAAAESLLGSSTAAGRSSADARPSSSRLGLESSSDRIGSDRDLVAQLQQTLAQGGHLMSVPQAQHFIQLTQNQTSTQPSAAIAQMEQLLAGSRLAGAFPISQLDRISTGLTLNSLSVSTKGNQQSTLSVDDVLRLVGQGQRGVALLAAAGANTTAGNAASNTGTVAEGSVNPLLSMLRGAGGSAAAAGTGALGLAAAAGTGAFAAASGNQDSRNQSGATDDASVNLIALLRAHGGSGGSANSSSHTGSTRRPGVDP
ncbi:expressed unknown protein [Seminavis robusta]|uniref:BZIP domain-containing protein n=1 Tax=Seminavis robusta TaxID=568900 RepID=A0A9N8HFY4_9STRA|nr:expressed unknown protein [Seminavis robusta]|eukprot:Sro372_g128680.2  (450) ;mRNA; r:6698-8138